MPLSQMGVTSKNQECLNLLLSKNYFLNEISAAQFAALYLIRNHDIESILEYPIDKYNPKGGFMNKWHLSDVDNELFIRKSLLLFDTRIADADYALRSAVSLGLDKIHEKISDNNWDILDLL